MNHLQSIEIVLQRMSYQNGLFKYELSKSSLDILQSGFHILQFLLINSTELGEIVSDFIGWFHQFIQKHIEFEVKDSDSG